MCWRFKSYWMHCCVDGWVFLTFWRTNGPSFSANLSKMSETTYQMTQHHILEDLNLWSSQSKNEETKYSTLITVIPCNTKSNSFPINSESQKIILTNFLRLLSKFQSRSLFSLFVCACVMPVHPSPSSYLLVTSEQISVSTKLQTKLKAISTLELLIPYHL